MDGSVCACVYLCTCSSHAVGDTVLLWKLKHGSIFPSFALWECWKGSFFFFTSERKIGFALPQICSFWWRCTNELLPLYESSVASQFYAFLRIRLLWSFKIMVSDALQSHCSNYSSSDLPLQTFPLVEFSVWICYKLHWGCICGLPSHLNKLPLVFYLENTRLHYSLLENEKLVWFYFIWVPINR